MLKTRVVHGLSDQCILYQTSRPALTNVITSSHKSSTFILKLNTLGISTGSYDFPTVFSLLEYFMIFLSPLCYPAVLKSHMKS